MLLPSSKTLLTKRTQDIKETCRASASQRAALCRLQNQWIETGRSNGNRALVNKLYAHNDRLASHLFSPSELAFMVDFEAHYARYDAGHFYSRHLDRFNDESSRTISVVIYLNDSWTQDDGGELRLYVTPQVDVRPAGGTLVCFTSDKVEHEVLPSSRTRTSLAAWFRRPRK